MTNDIARIKQLTKEVEDIFEGENYSVVMSTIALVITHTMVVTEMIDADSDIDKQLGLFIRALISGIEPIVKEVNQNEDD